MRITKTEINNAPNWKMRHNASHLQKHQKYASFWFCCEILHILAGIVRFTTL